MVSAGFPLRRETEKMAQQILFQGKHRKFGNFDKTQEKHQEFVVLKS